MESDESLGYHWGSWLGDGIQPRDGLTEGDEANNLEWSPLPSLVGERAASSPEGEQADRNQNIHLTTMFGYTDILPFWLIFTVMLTSLYF